MEGNGEVNQMGQEMEICAEGPTHLVAHNLNEARRKSPQDSVREIRIPMLAQNGTSQVAQQAEPRVATRNSEGLRHNGMRPSSAR